MKSHTKHDWIIGFIIVPFLLMCANVLSHNHWDSLNNPEGKFTNVSEYLAQERPPSYITKINKQGTTFFIAYSSMDEVGLALPSGPAAYVFDETGKLIQWSSDIGEDPQFQQQ
ncbi:hypothetical protein [Gimesia aquarii]|uniref:Uncharacterized protein n=1 Tax=Gimesia aquarii TaxID=2527964 RepID=A0A517WR74_9PLAN|nr:hypothetical protein [Gimesia aquarii]QDU07718.1 hypothetical protein V202x_10790 [Gimesia aquarii]